jgi:hypothetical protein
MRHPDRNNRHYFVYPSVVLIGVSLWVVIMHPILLKIGGGYLGLSDNARFLLPLEGCSIKVNGLPDQDIRCFSIKSDFSGKEVSQLVLVLKDSQTMIIDMDNNDAGRPNSSSMDYSLIFNRILVQARSGYSYLSFSNGVKFCGEDPNVRQQIDGIKIRVPCGYKSIENGSNLVIDVSK